LDKVDPLDTMVYFDHTPERVMLTGKVKTIHQRDVDIFETRLTTIEQQVELLKQATVMHVLGSDQGRLVLLEGVRESKDNTEGSWERRVTKRQREADSAEHLRSTTQ
jgi:hypothetical protein